VNPVSAPRPTTSRSTTRRPATGRSLATRLLLAQGLVLVASILTAALVAAIVGPPLFHQHLIEAGHSPHAPELTHIERAYRDASVISLGVALLIALACALSVTWYLTRRIQRPLTLLTDAAREMSGGHYTTRVAVAGAGPELSSLGDAFNAMAARLESTEDTRRRLLSDLAHELRTPIATIGAYLDGLEDGVAQWGPQTAHVMRDQTDRLVRLAEDIDDVSRAEEGRLVLEKSPTPVDDLLYAASQAVAASFAEKGVALITIPSPATLVIDVDRERFAQVLGNLLGNALRHTPRDGTVTVFAEGADGSVVVTVTDTGEGMTVEQLPHVFERFYRGDNARDRGSRGSGIGLTISKAIVDAHGGTLTASSPGVGLGSTFAVTLPTS
jgi:two-component system sensor histidine kinase BaeS